MEPVALFLLLLLGSSALAGAAAWLLVGESADARKRAIGVGIVLAVLWAGLQLSFTLSQAAAGIGLTLGMTFAVAGAICGAEITRQIRMRVFGRV